MIGISLIKFINLNLVLKCKRCEYSNEISNIESNEEIWNNCTKCKTLFGINYNQGNSFLFIKIWFLYLILYLGIYIYLIVK